MHRAGTYTTALHVTTPMNIVGEGEPGEIILTAQYKDVVTWEANGGSIKNVTIKCVGECDTYGIWVKKGGLTVEGCDITSQGLACIQVAPACSARTLTLMMQISSHKPYSTLRGCLFHDAAQTGVMVCLHCSLLQAR